jgi:hypothetical protein
MTLEIQWLKQPEDGAVVFITCDQCNQKYWGSYFTDYLLHRVYSPTLNVPGGKDGKAVGNKNS